MMHARFVGVPLIALALVLDAHDASAALAQAWPPFVLVAGLLMVGLVAGSDGLYDAAAARLVALPGPPLALALACFALVAVVTALLNLDSSVVFLTPVLIATARRRGLGLAPFVYGSVFMANASSLFLPGSNLTNLLVLERAPTSGATFFVRMAPMALAATLITAAGLMALHRGVLLAGGSHARERAVARMRVGAGLVGTLAAAVLVVVLGNAAPEVAALGVALVALRVYGGEMRWRATIASLGLGALASLFGLAVALGTLARASAFPADALHGASAPVSALVAALASVAVNNLPAAVLLSAGRRIHVDALLLGLNVGPNLAVSGSLAVLLWWRTARASGVRPSALEYSRQGLLLAPLALAGALALGSG